jgi:hypothetical protein
MFGAGLWSIEARLDTLNDDQETSREEEEAARLKEALERRMEARERLENLLSQFQYVFQPFSPPPFPLSLPLSLAPPLVSTYSSHRSYVYTFKSHQISVLVLF